MVDEFIRQLPHENDAFENQWPNTYDRLQKLFDEGLNNNNDILGFKVKTLDAVVDYVLTEPLTSMERSYAKHAFVEKIVKECADDPLPSLVEIVRVVRRVLDLPGIFNEWYLTCIEAFHYKFHLCERLSSTKSVDLVETIFQSLQKHSFLNGQVDKDIQEKWEQFLSRRLFSPLSMDTNKLNNEELMIAMRPAFQQIFRHAVRLSHRSRVWSEVVPTLIRTLPNLFDSYVHLTDGQIDLLACIEPPISTDFVFLITKSYNRNVDLLKANFTVALTVIERLLLMNSIREARYFVDQAVLTHINVAVDFDALLRMLIRVCPLINVDHRNEACKEVISVIAYKLSQTKFNKKQAPLCFDFALIILDLCVIEAPKSAEYLLEKNEFYPWKELAPRFTGLVRSCAAYDTIDVTTPFSDLDSLASILRLVVERGKVHATIFQATHDEALRAILRWAGLAENDNKKTWPTHVYRMAEAMLNLIDQRQVTVDICAQFIEALRKKVVSDEEDDNQEGIDHAMVSFYSSLAGQVASYIDVLKTLPHEVHRSLACFFLAALLRPLQYENGQESLEHRAASVIWFRLCPYLANETDVRAYEPCIKQIHSLACADGEVKFFNWWSTFWTTVTFKVPDVAADYIEVFFSDVIDRKQTAIAALLHVSQQEEYSRRIMKCNGFKERYV